MGRYRRGYDAAGNPVQEITYSNTLRPDQVPRVVAHESGHAIDEMAGPIDTSGVSKELERVYSDLITGQQGRMRHKTRPKDLGYATAEQPRELMTEAIRA